MILAHSRGVGIYKASDGSPLTCEQRDCSSDTNSSQLLYTWSLIKNTPAVADLDNDGDLEIVAAARHKRSGGSGTIFAWTNLADVINSDEELGREAYATPWPQFKGNARHSGVFGEE